MANGSSHNVSVLLNNGDGTFQAGANYGAGDDPKSVFAVDLDGDGDNDMAVANAYSDDISILFNLSSMTGVDDFPETSLPESFSISQNYPNPFNAATTLNYWLDEPGFVSIAIYNILGQRVATLVEGIKQSGEYSIIWDAADHPSGIYFARLTVGGVKSSMKLVLLK